MGGVLGGPCIAEQIHLLNDVELPITSRMNHGDARAFVESNTYIGVISLFLTT